MKKHILIAMMAFATPFYATWAQSAPPPEGDNDFGGKHPKQEQRFEAHKQAILKHMNEHLAEIQQHIACVQAATNPESLRACMPEHVGSSRPPKDN